ncbi:MAG TPA: NADH-quinone oxidoreductase subunit NuoG [Fimbriimonadaceae bacterium]|nr:NADH-quinone oxidoreductase subunit NuoG [Fimbriimonadaceae bacterium]HRJ96950.1 NADH-quinone oxidoreductase subunit NuoG [Fimbriimonadaceae bacterium]
MAAAPTTDTVTISINDVEIEVPKGELIVDAVKRLGLEIPIFCYHSRMKPVGMCRMCLVEVGFKQPDGSVRKMPKPQAGCTLPASEGMAVYTDTELVHKDRRGVLEFLLINHPLDCPICDRGGECPLQNNTLFYGPSTSRFIELKRHLPKAFPLSRYVTLDLERCIQCGRCVRFTEEISGDAQLAFRFRGANMQPTSFQLTEFESKFSGNVIEICPVGALTSTKYRFRARPWDLETKPAICTVCSNGCSVWFDYRVGKFVRLNGRVNEAVNEEWTCDRGKFGHDFYNSPKRLLAPALRKEDALRTANWAEAYAAILEAFEPGGNAVAALTGPMVSNESYYLLQKLFRGVFRSNNLDHRWTRHLSAASDRLESKMGMPTVATSIEAFEHKSAVLAIGTSLADEEPILFLRLRKAWFKNGTKVVVACDRDTDADSFAHLVLRYRPGTEMALAGGLLAAAVESGRATVPDPVREDLKRYSPSAAASATGVPEDRIREAADILGPNAAIVTTHRLLDVADAQGTLEYLAGLAMCLRAEFNLYALGANDQGALELGIHPELLPSGVALADAEAAAEVGRTMGIEIPREPGLGTHELLRACADGRIKALWLVGCDPFALHADRDLVQRALEGVEFLVVQDIVETEATSYASVILPMLGPAEQDGTYTNMERRVQRLRQVIPDAGDAKPAWRIFAEAMLRAQPQTPFFSAEEIMEEIARVAPAFEVARYDRLGHEGTRL